MSSVLAAAVPARATSAVRRVRTRVMQITDWLEPGGKERVALNIANLLPRDRFESFLCTTRVSTGSLEKLVAPDVPRLRLDRTRTVDLAALHKLVAFNTAQGIDVLHAHGSSLFIASIASLFPPYPKVVWHDHYGPYRRDDRPTWLYRLAASRIGGVIAVNQALLDWAQRELLVPSNRAWYVPNFVCADAPDASAVPAGLPGMRDQRVVCVAHLRPQKDHPTLLQAFATVRASAPDAHLLLIGGHSDAHYRGQLVQLIDRLGLAAGVTIMGQRDDVPRVLAASAVGVLSSESEGFPLALVEYGHARLAAVATDVGQCRDILDDGRAGLLVSPSNPEQLAAALLQLLQQPAQRRRCADALHHRVRDRYGAGRLVGRICAIYDRVHPVPR